MRAKRAQGDRLYLRVHCPGCDCSHVVPVEGPGAWDWNGNLHFPTLSPSILVTYNGDDAGRDGAPPAVCHGIVTDGRIYFCPDSTHALGGQTVDLPELPEVAS